MKGSATKTPVSCPTIIKMFNQGMEGVDLIDQKTAAYRLDRKSKFRFYLRLFFDLMDVALVNSHIVYSKLWNDICLLDFKIVIATSLIGRYSNRQRSYPTGHTNKRKSLEASVPAPLPMHLLTFQSTRKRCQYCRKEGLDNKTFVSCETCGIYLCCVKERNCFKKHHF